MLVATAGHIDHGKTSLVRALTGVDTDRLPEERARGISIDLGFAYWRPDEVHTIGFVDVPGHERFVRNMLAGVGGIDLALLVVAADDGVMPQTVEHAQILDLLGISRAIVAITKSDRASRERTDAVRSQIEALLSNSAFAAAPTFEVSTINGTGISDLGNALRAASTIQVSRHRPGRAFRLAIDRAFSVTGIGTVVTGTVLDGTVKVGDRLRTAPKGFDVRVRGLQTGGKTVDAVVAGERCAVNLAGVEKGQVRRGDLLITPRMDAPSSHLEARLRVLSTREHALKHYTPVHLHLGTADIEARVLIAHQKSVPPGGEGLVRLALDSSVIAAVGDRFVLRDQSARSTVGGGVIVDPLCDGNRHNHAARAPFSAALNTLDPAQALTVLFEIPDYELQTEQFERRFNLELGSARILYEQVGAALLGTGHRLALPASRIAAVSAQIIEILAAFHQDSPELEGLSSRDLKAKLSQPISLEAFASLLRDLQEKRSILSLGPIIKLPTHKAIAALGDQSLWQRLLPWLQERGAMPFTALEVAQEAGTSEALTMALLHRKRSLGEIWQITGERYLLREQVAALAARAEVLNRATGETGFTAAQYRDAISTGRTWAIQVLEFFDSVGVTRRSGNMRRIRPDYALIVGTAEPYGPGS